MCCWKRRDTGWEPRTGWVHGNAELHFGDEEWLPLHKESHPWLILPSEVTPAPSPAAPSEAPSTSNQFLKCHSSPGKRGKMRDILTGEAVPHCRSRGCRTGESSVCRSGRCCSQRERANCCPCAGPRWIGSRAWTCPWSSPRCSPGFQSQICKETGIPSPG